MPARRPLVKGYKRVEVRCRRCGTRSYYDYVPYSLSNPVFTTPCGHDFRTDYEEVPVKKPKRRPRKLSVERASAINRRRDLVEGTQKSYETKRIRVRPGRGKTVEE